MKAVALVASLGVAATGWVCVWRVLGWQGVGVCALLAVVSVWCGE